MSYYSGSTSTFYNIIKMKDSKDQPLDTVHVIVNDPYRVSDHNFVTGGWDGVLRYIFIKLQDIIALFLKPLKKYNWLIKDFSSILSWRCVSEKILSLLQVLPQEKSLQWIWPIINLQSLASMMPPFSNYFGSISLAY